MYLDSLSKTLRSLSKTIVPALEHYYFPQNPLIFSSFLRSISSNTSGEHANQEEVTVSYLVNSCGLSLESAKSASKHVRFDTPDTHDSFLSLLKSYNFSQTQISKLVKHCPRFLLSKPEEMILPKFEFLTSKGLADHEIAKLVSSCPFILRRSLENHIIPTYDYFKGLLQSDKKTIMVIKRYSNVLLLNSEILMARSISILRNNGVPESSILKLLVHWPRIVLMKPDKMERVLKEARKMGFDPSKFLFCHAIGVLGAISKSTWESKLDVFRKWNFSEELVLKAFKQNPMMMAGSKKKIMATVEFLVKQLGWEPSLIANYSVLLTLSLERRLIPRALVLQHLVSKGLIKKENISPTVFKYTDAKFHLKFVKSYPEIPELLKLYGKKAGLPCWN